MAKLSLMHEHDVQGVCVRACVVYVYVFYIPRRYFVNFLP